MNISCRFRAVMLGMFASSVLAMASNPDVVRLWPTGAPHSNGLEGVAPTGDNTFLTGVNEALLTVYPADNFCGVAIVMCPGGGYAGIALNHEGHDMAAWYNSQCITYAVLQYRMPNCNDRIPLEDAGKAMHIMRERMPENTRIGIGGASAGGHLAATLANHYPDSLSRPDFQVLFYPVITMDRNTHKGSSANLLGTSPNEDSIEWYSLEKQVSPLTPPAILLLSSDDTAVPPINSIDYFNALISNGVPAALHVYPNGGHGWGFSETSFKPLWQAELSEWLKQFKNSELY